MRLRSVLVDFTRDAVHNIARMHRDRRTGQTEGYTEAREVFTEAAHIREAVEALDTMSDAYRRIARAMRSGRLRDRFEGRAEAAQIAAQAARDAHNKAGEY